jgi:hypothetical protein
MHWFCANFYGNLSLRWNLLRRPSDFFMPWFFAIWPNLFEWRYTIGNTCPMF